MLSRYIRDGKLSLVFRIMLIILDIISINISSYLALLVRFELKWSSIEPECLIAVNRMCIFNTLITIIP